MKSQSSDATVLVVDDDKGLARLIERTLRREGFSAAIATSGAEAIDWLNGHRADLMLLDLKLQDMEGEELIHRLEQDGHAIPFVIITGQGDERVAVEMMKRGALDYLVKDMRFQEFVPAVVRRALDQMETGRRLAAAEEALKKEHAFVSAILNTSGALIVVLERDGRIVRFNPACEKATGYSADEARGKTVWELFIPPAEAEALRTVFERTRSGAALVRHESHWMTKDGSRRLIDWTRSALRDEHGGVEYIIAAGIDITERKRLEREILEISDLEQRRIGQDLHDGICQRLAGIGLMSEVLERRLESRCQAEAARAGEIAEGVRQTIEETRRLARGLSPVVLEAEGLMSALAEMAANTARMFQVKCRFRCPQPVLLTGHTAATHLFRIAQEAVSNAIRHGKADHIDISLADDDGKVVVSVRDNGTGISKSHNDLKGMGLRIMQYRAGMIGGGLHVGAHPDGGTLVTCSAPGNYRPGRADKNHDNHSQQESEENPDRR